MTQPRAHPFYRSRAAIPLAVCTVCLALAALTLLVPSAPTTDPWGWIVWGREVVHLKLNTDVQGSPSWKPLPVLVTVPLSVAGSAAPTLWVLLSRAAGLLGLVVAFRVAATLVGDRGVAARWVAGALAAAGLVLSWAGCMPSRTATASRWRSLSCWEQSTATWPGGLARPWSWARSCPARARGLHSDVTNGTATIKVPRKAVVMFLPFAKKRVRFTDSPRRLEPARLGTSGHWSVYATNAARCRRLLARRAG